MLLGQLLPLQRGLAASTCRLARCNRIRRCPINRRTFLLLDAGPSQTPSSSPWADNTFAKGMAGLQAMPVKAGEPTSKTKFDEVDEGQFVQRDAARRRLGKLAQDIAILSEQKRLREAGHPSPEEAVRAVWDEPGRGYDILSCELDGTPRYIEVKAARQSGQKLSFFLTQNEWIQSRSKSNYCFYLVLKVDSKRPDVRVIESGEVSPDCLAPLNYLASLRAPSD